MDTILSSWDADDKGIWSKDSVSFGHRMLWNTPQSKLEQLPHIISTCDQTLVITIDIRLDNREILVKQLNMTDLPLAEITDSNIVLAAYHKWGELCPKYLLGDFVFAIWDINKQQLFCARDHIGIKPFYYYLSDDLFVFSNDIRGLIVHPAISKKYNDKSIAMFLSGDFGFYDKENTMFSEIYKLEAATSLTITKNNISKSIYWNIEDIPTVQYDTYEEYVEKLRELLLDAVRVRLRTSYPVASHLSGGLDSSAIAVLAARELKKRNHILYAFNWVEEPIEKKDIGYSELAFASQLENLENIEQKYIKLTAEFISEMHDKIDITIDDTSYYWGEYLVRDEAEKYKVRTFLSGWGGDELVSYHGYAYLSGAFRQAHFIKGIQKIYEMYSHKKMKYKYLRIIKRVIKELVYPYFYEHMSGLYQEKKLKSDPFEFIQSEFLPSAKEYTFKSLNFCPGAHNEQKALFTQGHILQRIENWASSAIDKKIEYTYPLLDKRIVEFSLAIPDDLFAWKDGYHRYLFRRVISDFLPKNIVWAAKNPEIEHDKVRIKLWYKSLKLWLEKNEKNLENRNYYVNRLKIIKRLEIYFRNQENGVEDDISDSEIATSILVSNLKNTR